MLTPTQFGELLADRRKMGESLAQIGAQLGVSYQAVQQWISGKSAPSGTVLILAELLSRAAGGDCPLCRDRCVSEIDRVSCP